MHEHPDHASGGQLGSGNPFAGFGAPQDHGPADFGSHGPEAIFSPMHGGAGLGGGDAGWASSFEHALIEHLPADLFGSGFGSGAGGFPLVVVPIDHLDVNTFNTFNTFVDQTNVLLDAANGGQIAVGGNVDAFGTQTALLDPTHLLPHA